MFRDKTQRRNVLTDKNIILLLFKTPTISIEFLNFITIHNYFCDLCKFYQYTLVIFSQIRL